MANQEEQDTSRLSTRKNIFRRLIQVTISVFLIAIILLVSAGRIEWFYAWVYIVTSVLVVITNAFIFPPELISERGRKKENVEKWDRLMSGLIIIPWLALYIVAGLDIRFGWSPELALWIHIAGLVFFILGNAFVSWAMISNTYFSTAVRIQYDRGHAVSSGGPYRYMRHPGYLGMIISILSTSIILGSIWALLPASLTVILFIIRTAFEDNTLQNKLEGYKEYAERVKYRLIPGIW
ncbi:MAG TPA: isoprenylcysteine carboxylmethyltransferase family protein [bacterium]